MTFSRWVILLLFISTSVWAAEGLDDSQSTALADIRHAAEAALSRLDYHTFSAKLNEIPSDSLKDSERTQKEIMAAYFGETETQPAPKQSLQQSLRDDIEVDKGDQMFESAVYWLISGNTQAARVGLLQVLFYNPDHAKARYFLERFFGMKPGTYLIQDQLKQLKNESEVKFYLGQFSDAIQALTLLADIDPQNPVIFERLGSCYFASAQFEKARKAWATVLVLDPKNTQIKHSIQQLDARLEADKVATQKQAQVQKKQTQPDPKKDYQLMGTYFSRDDAYEKAAEFIKNGFDPIVEPVGGGKWQIKIERKPKGTSS